MSEGGGGWRLEVAILLFAAVGAAVAWSTRDARRASIRPWDTVATAPATSPVPSTAVPDRRRHHSSPLSAVATQRARELCAVMAKSQVGFALKQELTTEITDSYGVGDPESGAGDSLIVEGIARSATGLVSDFRCSMADLGAYAGSPFITHHERQ